MTALSWKITANDHGVIRLHAQPAHRAAKSVGANRRCQQICQRTERQLRAYLSGRLRKFSVPVDIGGLSSFTQAVLRATTRIGYGQTRSYRWLAVRLGNPKAARAVGNALARNPVPMLIPCHRVVRCDGRIGRFVLGAEWKKRLLDLEKSSVKTKASSRNAG